MDHLNQRACIIVLAVLGWQDAIETYSITTCSVLRLCVIILKLNWGKTRCGIWTMLCLHLVFSWVVIIDESWWLLMERYGHKWNFALTLIINLCENAEWLCCVFVNNYILENGESFWGYIPHKFDMCLEFVRLDVLCSVNFCFSLMSPYSRMHSDGSTLHNLLQIGSWT